MLLTDCGDGSSFLRGKERIRSGKRTNIGGDEVNQLKTLIMLFADCGDGSSFLRGKERNRSKKRTKNLETPPFMLYLCTHYFMNH